MPVTHYENPDLVEAHLPVPHVFCDGSVSDLAVILFEGSDGAFLSTGMNHEGISIASPSQARALANALLIAANLREKELQS